MHEPRSALDGGVDGLSVLRRAATRARYWLRPGGWFFTECALDQADSAVAVLRDAGLIATVANDTDLEVAIGRANAASMTITSGDESDHSPRP